MVPTVQSEDGAFGNKSFRWLYLGTPALSGIPDEPGVWGETVDALC